MGAWQGERGEANEKAEDERGDEGVLQWTCLSQSSARPPE